MYCPQWCYFVFPPPPPAFDLGGPDTDDSSGPTFSPLVIAIIGVLASAFLLVSYYTIISKYCGTFTSLWNMVFGSRRRHGHGRGGGGDGDGGSRSQDPWSAAPSDGLDETLINKITVCKYKRGDGFVDSTDCSVCLGEFRDGESLRLLPKCSHAFHLPCIDTWLKSHSNCPLCRCNIAFVTVGVVSPEPERRRAPPEDDRRDRPPEVVLTIDDYSEQARDGEPQNQNAAGTRSEEAAKDCPGRSEEGSGIGEIKEDGGAPAVMASSSLSDTHREGRMSIADVLQASLEDELMMARESGLLAGSSGSSRRHGEQSNKDGGGGRSGRALPDAAKRLPTVGRSCFSSRNGGGRGKDSVLPM
ncbi:hypothetical protein HU200_049808 [Digitaria exilis]|uniref:RING-type E3 ubiquitin transferase n=1 Tax=Digitaria exilis TaxID=1010633 RepID=A0A835AT55_9POAL|nr:hypothetical protein HU200_049808 [Digitaria exilis]